MSRSKLIGLIVMLALIVGSIWYLEGLKTGPTAATLVQSPAIPIAATTTPAQSTVALAAIAAADKKAGLKPAIELADPTGFINTPPFKLADLIGKKVILVDFWTYSCINCIRTLPYLASWYKKYRDQGLEIVGVHTPEFDFEKEYANVQAATKKYGIAYPVVMDSNYGTWQAYGNLYWPHEYLIDAAGYIVHDHIGEGGYDETEQTIQKLLAQQMALAGKTFVPPASPSPIAEDLSGIGSPETYFGAARNEYLANRNPMAVGTQSFTRPQDVVANTLYLVGDWSFDNEFATNAKGGEEIIYKYRAAKVFFVGSAAPGVILNILQDGKPVAAEAGSDVKDGNITINESRLYNLINNPDGSGEHTLDIIIQSPELHAYTFTFG